MKLDYQDHKTTMNMNKLLWLGLYFLFSQSLKGINGEVDNQMTHCPLNCTCNPVIQSVMCEQTHRFHIPTNIPDGTVVLGLPKNEFTSLSRDTFTGLSTNASIESLILYDNKIASIEPYTFENLRKLRKLWLFGNRLTQLRAHGFAGLRNLTELYLSQNFLTDIERNAFADLRNLQLLQLWGNQLVRLNSDSFAGLENLSNLTLGKTTTGNLKHQD